MKLGDLVRHNWLGSGEPPHTLFTGVVVNVRSGIDNIVRYEIIWFDKRRKPDIIVYEEGELNVISDR